MKSPEVLIIGAGAAGLMAAYRLADRCSVTILEALDRTGGRIHSFHMDDTPIEAGAEFVHGDLPLTKALIKEAGLHLEKITGRMFAVQNCEWKEQDEFIDGWDELLNRMKHLGSDLTLDGFLETYFPDAQYEELRRHTRAFAAGFDLADPTRASAMALYKEWSGESDKQFRIREGYGGLISYLTRVCREKGCNIRLNTRVKQVEWEQDQVTAHTTDGEIFKAGRMIVTLSAGVMQKKDSPAYIRITPALPGHEEAWQHIGFGTVLKVVLVFRKSFWEEHQDNPGFLFSSETIPTWWTQPNHILTGWLGGPAAVQWDNRDESYILEQALQSLARIFRMDVNMIADLLQNHHIGRWHALETFAGAYSYETPMSGAARQLLAAPVNNTLYFAGEALYDGSYPGTVEAALESGRAVAENILGSQ